MCTKRPFINLVLVFCIGLLPATGAYAVADGGHMTDSCASCEMPASPEPVRCGDAACTSLAGGCGANCVFSVLSSSNSWPGLETAAGDEASATSPHFKPNPAFTIYRPPIA